MFTILAILVAIILYYLLSVLTVYHGYKNHPDVIFRSDVFRFWRVMLRAKDLYIRQLFEYFDTQKEIDRLRKELTAELKAKRKIDKSNSI